MCLFENCSYICNEKNERQIFIGFDLISVMYFYLLSNLTEFDSKSKLVLEFAVIKLILKLILYLKLKCELLFCVKV